MKLNVNYVDDEKRLRAWNIDEPVIEFYNDLQHSVVPLSKVSGLRMKKMLKQWLVTVTEFLEKLESINNGELGSDK